MGKIIIYDEIDPTNKLRGEVKNSLWSVDEYYPVKLDIFYPQHFPNYTAPRNLSEIRRWLERELEGEIIIKTISGGGSLQVWAYFELEDEAVRCKLTWYGDSYDDTE